MAIGFVLLGEWNLISPLSVFEAAAVLFPPLIDRFPHLADDPVASHPEDQQAGHLGNNGTAVALELHGTQFGKSTADKACDHAVSGQALYDQDQRRCTTDNIAELGGRLASL